MCCLLGWSIMPVTSCRRADTRLATIPRHSGFSVPSFQSSSSTISAGDLLSGCLVTILVYKPIFSCLSTNSISFPRPHQIFAHGAVGIEVAQEPDRPFHAAKPALAVSVVIFGNDFVLQLRVEILGIQFDVFGLARDRRR